MGKSGILGQLNGPGGLTGSAVGEGSVLKPSARSTPGGFAVVAVSAPAIHSARNLALDRVLLSVPTAKSHAED